MTRRLAAATLATLVLTAPAAHATRPGPGCVAGAWSDAVGHTKWQVQNRIWGDHLRRAHGTVTETSDTRLVKRYTSCDREQTATAVYVRDGGPWVLESVTVDRFSTLGGVR